MVIVVLNKEVVNMLTGRKMTTGNLIAGNLIVKFNILYTHDLGICNF